VPRPTHNYRSADATVEQLLFDPQNPRLPASVDASDIGAVLTFMLDDAGLVDLASSIAAQGFFPGEPLLCCPHPELPQDEMPPAPTEADQLVVVEGNRRLAAVRLLRNPELAPKRKRAIAQLAEDGAPDRLPVIVFPRRAAILDYLGYRHITGIKEWDPLAKARYLHQVRDRKRADGEPATNRDLARLIGSNAPYVGRLLTAFAAWGRLQALGFFAEKGLDPEELAFSVFSTALNYENIPPWLGIDPTDDATVSSGNRDNLARLANWFFVSDERVPGNKPLLRESRNIRFINLIVGHDDAMQTLEADAVTPSQAARLTQDAAAVVTDALHESHTFLRAAHRRLPEVERPTEEHARAVLEIRDEAAAMHGDIVSRDATPAG
jgi:hypothetical protein